MLEVKNITMTYDKGGVNELTIFKDFSLTINDGQFLSVVGSNGSGKTTLLNIICGSLTPQEGSVILNGNDISAEKEYRRNRLIGRVYQNPSVGTCPNMTISENLALADNKGSRFGLRPAFDKKKEREFRDLVASLSLGLEDKMDMKMGSLSGGQRQALSLLIATLRPIDFLVLDEHTAALDPVNSEFIMELTRKTVERMHLMTIMVTHNLRHAVEYGDRLVMMDKGTTVLDIDGEAKKHTRVEDVLGIFNSISIECGN
ncbi:MAG: ATP-binding cassette domain-containing protein [Eubacteriaceae bacterium]|nr:ATP-binding cassette domain-containing protein [Eubacteriaceae bacterium]MBR5995254.1 ATP-binding cassette domain-containing protein [Eubacteriaceae bacterium]